MTFKRTMTVSQFQNQYYYRTELQQICRELSLPVAGTKAELNQRIINFLSGKVQPKSARVVSNQLQAPLTLTTKVLSGVKLNQSLRQFMAAYYGRSQIKFNKAMAVAIRQVKAEQDESFTVADLLAIYEGRRQVDTSQDDPSYQWNQFLKDYCADPHNQQVANKLAAAAKLWQQIKTQPGPKIYQTPSL
ncbi:SAP domain-containing protein [Lapidilactobacillus wuchangensis]|uniref:SAP domain-containing protein n=1 Tax=Lapidilactobacillus wuchangensis TaxID=2486001 RepID=UPI000F76D1FE|nr:SAP domain-containing protein [Lapidilactobacillus wuchangensis]